ncbi:MAG: hypothetical protein ABI624_25105, partial [Casimicrobiaceae bacterium]
ADAALEAWKAGLEDPESRREFRTASIWAAIRHAHGGLLRTPYGVLVADETLVDQVLTDPESRYTVCGYQQRLTDTIGPIFLGLDAGAEYDRQATACNAAIMKLTFEDGYARARDYTHALLDGWVVDADQRARGYGESRWELNIDIRDVAWRVLAGLLEDWFGLKPGADLMRDGFDWAFSKDEPARYPGAFYTPSRYTFQPQPAKTVRDIARQQGQHLRDRMAHFLKAEDAGITAPVTRAVLDDSALQADEGTKDYDLAARTISGAIMGFVPTTDNNLRRIVDEWLRDQTIWRLRARAGAGSLAEPAEGWKLLGDAVVRTMMLRPMPEFIWRTAVKDHVLDTTDGGVFDVHVHERLVLGLVSATQRGLERGGRDVVAVFGGDRWADPAPRHACPGRHSAMGVIAGVLSAIIDTRHVLRPTAATGLLSFEGPVTAVPVPAVAKSNLNWAMAAGVALVGSSTFAAPAGSKGVLLGWGDSWFNLDHPLAGADGWDLPRSLAKLGWNTAGFAEYSTEGLTLKKMAAVEKRKGFYRAVFSSILQGQKPRAILIDGGGNDVHQSALFGRSPLYDLAAPAGSKPPLNDKAVRKFVHVELLGYLTTVLTNLVDVTGGSIPILIHGYDHPIPDGRGFGIGPVNFPWLAPVNDRTLYSLQQGTEIMQLLIDELNDMIIDAVNPFAAKGARHLKLTGTLAKQPGFAADYTQWWLNELHPTQNGYDALAAVADAAIAAALAAVP